MLLGRKLPHIRGTNEVFGERDFVENYSNQLCQGFLTLEAAQESYNMTFRESQKVSMMRLFLAKNPRVGVHFDKEERQAKDITTDLDREVWIAV